MQNVDEPTTMGMVFLSGVVIQVVLHTVVAISVNRMIAIRFPHAYKRVSTWRAVFAAIGGIWLSGLLLWLPPILAYLFRGNEFSQSKTMFSSKKILGVIFQAIFCFFLPILVAIASYCVILFHIGCCHRFGGNGNQSDPNSGSSLERQPWKDEVTRTIFVVFVILLICGVPHSATHVLEAFNMVTPLTWFLIHILHNLQFIVDPIVYVTMSPRYRRAFAKVLKNLFRGRLFSERTISTSSQASTGTSRGSKSQKTESTTV
ncbi:galanin receptor type 2-like isoform X1 [Oratosquilla oratoria]|uniref:galanin receptor type 2-like isoform X1 n=1 Tax=Oratosquilla oratoria TaxID=337810 RepID=UPI003F77129E